MVIITVAVGQDFEQANSQTFRCAKTKIAKGRDMVGKIGMYVSLIYFRP